MEKLILVGADPFPPYQYYGEDGSICGSDYQIVKKVFNKAGYKIKVVLDEWQNIENAVINKEMDAAFQVQYTIEREKKYYFSELFRNAVTEVVTGFIDLRLSTFDEIKDKKVSVGVINNYSYGEAVDSLDSSLKKAFNSQNELLQAINDRMVDIGIFDKGVKEYIMEHEGYENIFSIKNLEFVRPLYVVFSNEDLRDEFNESMSRFV